MLWTPLILFPLHKWPFRNDDVGVELVNTEANIVDQDIIMSAANTCHLNKAKTPILEDFRSTSVASTKVTAQTFCALFVKLSRNSDQLIARTWRRNGNFRGTTPT